MPGTGSNPDQTQFHVCQWRNPVLYKRHYTGDPLDMAMHALYF